MGCSYTEELDIEDPVKITPIQGRVGQPLKLLRYAHQQSQTKRKTTPQKLTESEE